MGYVAFILSGLKTIYSIGLSLSRLVILNPIVKLLLVEYHKDQPWVHYYFCYMLTTCLTAPVSYDLESLLMILICFIQVLTYNTSNLL